MKDILDILKKKTNIIKFSFVKLSILSPRQSLLKSYGEIKKPETINYRTFRPEKNGLFCAKIFGPVNDYECLCMKYKKLKHRGVVCEKCGVEVTISRVRRDRMGHVKLISSVSHIWFLRILPSKISLLLNLSLSDVESILYFEQYVITDSGISEMNIRDIIDEEKFIFEYKKHGCEFSALMGGDALYDLLENLDINIEILNARNKLKKTNSEINIKYILKRLKLLRFFFKSINNPEWMIIVVLPILPPELRPLVSLDENKFASSDLNDLYRKVVGRNNRLSRLLGLNSPKIVIKNEKRMLQEIVDALIDNSKQCKFLNSNKKPLKSLSDMIKGKYGRFRQNLLGKRVDYSARSVIIPGPGLKLYQCGIPKVIAIELFKPFVFRELKKRGYLIDVKNINILINYKKYKIFDVLQDIVNNHPVLLNRAPTLHRLGVQAFECILINDLSIKLHPLVCGTFNADFDGDQMAIHVPITIEAQLEARILMMSTNNIISPSNGHPIIIPSQDIVFGLYYLSRIKLNKKNGVIFKSKKDMHALYVFNIINVNSKINFIFKNKKIITSYGRILISNILPNNISFEFVNKVMSKKYISLLINMCLNEVGLSSTVILLDQFMFIGFKFATLSGMSICVKDFFIPGNKINIIRNTRYEVNILDINFTSKLITRNYRYNEIIRIWLKTNYVLMNVMLKKLSILRNIDNVCESFNSVYMMIESGAKGSSVQVKQLASMRGLIVNPDGLIIEHPITSNLREGLDILQYFTSTHGAREGLIDTALKTANSGYLTRRLVDVSQNMVISEYDCLTNNGLNIFDLCSTSNTVDNLRDNVLGRFLSKEIYFNNKIIVHCNVIINEKILYLLYKYNINTICIRSIITCESSYGACSMCYGWDLTTNKIVDIGETIGIIAAQSIGEPGTQLTMRTFHIGGVVSNFSQKSAIFNNLSGVVKFYNIVLIKSLIRNKYISVTRDGKICIYYKKFHKVEHVISYGSGVYVKNNEKILKGKKISDWDIYNDLLISNVDGDIQFFNIINNLTIRREIDFIIIENLSRFLDIIPMIRISGKNSIDYYLQPGTILCVKDKLNVNIGDIIAKIPKDIIKVKDIIGGLPKIEDIFEVRKIKNKAILSNIDGKIFWEDLNLKRKITIVNNDVLLDIYVNKYRSIGYFKNNIVNKGDKICDGDCDLHDLLDIFGLSKLYSYMINKIQNVYKQQNVRINNKHIEVIIKQMLRKCVIIEPGNSNYYIGEEDYVINVKKTNLRLKNKNKKQVKFSIIISGITRSSLTTESFISAASFQETTKILTEAAIECKEDKLLGLKENVIVGRLIPAGTGFMSEKKNLI